MRTKRFHDENVQKNDFEKSMTLKLTSPYHPHSPLLVLHEHCSFHSSWATIQTKLSSGWSFGS
jgi:hypothetical protein